MALVDVLAEKLQLARARDGFPQPAYERFARQAPRYRRWGMETRHALGDAYPLYTLTTLRNLAEALFDFSTGFDDAPARARLLRPCAILFTSSVAQFASRVDPHIGALAKSERSAASATAQHGAISTETAASVSIRCLSRQSTSSQFPHLFPHLFPHVFSGAPYLLISDSADASLRLDAATRALLGSPRLHRWWSPNVELDATDAAPVRRVQPLPPCLEMQEGSQRRASQVTCDSIRERMHAQCPSPLDTASGSPVPVNVTCVDCLST